MIPSRDTIAAIATAPGRGGVAVIRVSGPESFAIAKKLTDRNPSPGRVIFSVFSNPISGVTIDDGLLLAFASPRSYTGEDVVEFQCHGGSVCPRRILEACIDAGARLARRGEFTERAFLNGKLDYDQAEAVLDLIDAKTDRAADAARAGLEGRVKRELHGLYDSALALASEIEHALDIDEDELPADFFVRVGGELSSLADSLRRALVRIGEGRLLREGALVVLAGPPNAGKSSLMNALLKENRAIVSDVAGTTRDSIEEWLEIDGWPVRLVDTAGLRETSDAIEAEGVRRSENLIASADLVIALGGECVGARRVIRVHSKCDLGRGAGLNVSVVSGEGLDELRGRIAAELACRAESAADEGDSTLASAELRRALAALPASVDDLVLAGDALRRASEILGAAIGATYTEDLLERLFSRFCVGK